MCPAAIRQVVWNISLSKLPEQYLLLGYNDDDQVNNNKGIGHEQIDGKDNDNKDIVSDNDMGDGNIYNGGIDDEDLKDG